MAVKSTTKKRKTCIQCRKKLISRQTKFCGRKCHGAYLTEHGNPGTGRKTDIRPEAVTKLVEAYQMGYSTTQAAMFAGIARTTIADWAAKSKEFAKIINDAMDFPQRTARAVVMKSIKAGNTNDARWWLERRQRDDFATRQELAGPDGMKLETVVIYRPEKLPNGYWRKDEEKKA